MRPDGLNSLQETYDIEFANAVGLDPSLVYVAMDEGQVDAIAGAATEGHIERLGFVKLKDDRGFFPPYYAAPVVRQALLEESPEVRDVLNMLAGHIDDDTMGSLNLEVDQDNRNHSDVARRLPRRRGPHRGITLRRIHGSRYGRPRREGVMPFRRGCLLTGEGQSEDGVLRQDGTDLVVG